MNRHVALVGQGGDVMINWPDFDMAPADWDKLTASLAKTKDPSKAVIECAFNHETYVDSFTIFSPTNRAKGKSGCSSLYVLIKIGPIISLQFNTHYSL